MRPSPVILALCMTCLAVACSGSNSQPATNKVYGTDATEGPGGNLFRHRARGGG